MEFNDNQNSTNLNLASNKKVIFWLIIFFPYGLYLMWKKTNWSKNLKVGISAIFIIICISLMLNSTFNDNTAKSDTGIRGIQLAHYEDVTLDLSKKYSSSKENYVRISSDNETFSINDLEFVSTDPQVATIELKEYESGNIVEFYIVGESIGETTVYVQTKDGIVKSEEIKVFCKGEVPTTTEPTTQESTVETTTEEETTKSTASDKTSDKTSNKTNNRTSLVKAQIANLRVNHLIKQIAIKVQVQILQVQVKKEHIF